MSSDELKTMPKGQFIVTKTGCHPLKVHLRLFTEWGITFDHPYAVQERVARPVAYASKDELVRSISTRYHLPEPDETKSEKSSAGRMVQDQIEDMDMGREASNVNHEEQHDQIKT